MSVDHPSRIAPDQLRMQTGTPDGGLTVGIAVDEESHGSRLVFGLEWIKAGTDRASWTANRETYEAYYVQQGTLQIAWSSPDEGETTVGPGDAFYFPPGHAYSIENVGQADVFVVWALTPRMPEPD